MALRQSLAVNVAPLVLRIALAITFIWAGLGKLTQTMEVRGDSAARLANMGVRLERAQPAPSGGQDPAPTDPIDAPSSRAPGTGASGLAMLPVLMQVEPRREAPAQPESAPEDAAPADTPRDEPTGERPATDRDEPPRRTTTRDGPEKGVKTAADYPDPIRVRRVYGIALLLSRGAVDPGVREDGSARPTIVPSFVVSGPTSKVPIVLAWAAALTELLAGATILVGLLTRLSALTLSGVMLTAIWLTTCGPAWQDGHGLLPNHPAFSVADWSTALWQLACLSMSLAVMLTGAGALSFDRMLFSAPGDGKPATQGPKPDAK